MLHNHKSMSCCYWKILVDCVHVCDCWQADALGSFHHIMHASLDLVEVLLAAGALPHGTGPQVSSNCMIQSHVQLMHILCISLCCESAVTQLLQSQLDSSSSLHCGSRTDLMHTPRIHLMYTSYTSSAMYISCLHHA